MKALIPLLIVSTSALAVTTVQFAQRAGAERKRADEARAIAEQRDTRIRELERARTALEEQLMEAQRPPMPASDAAVASAVPSSAPQPIRQKLATFTRVEPANSNGASAVRNVAPVPFGSNSPAAQRYMRSQVRASIRREYDDVGNALGLSQEQASKLLDLIADQHTRGMGEPRSPGQGNTVSSVFVGPDSPPPKQ